MTGSRPVVIAHRTCPLDAPENSIAGIQAAVRLGADAVEIDVRRARGGELVLNHDRSTWRLGRQPKVVRWSRSERMRSGGGGVQRFADLLADPAVTLPLAVDVKDAGAIGGVVAALQKAGIAETTRVWCRTPKAVAWAAAVKDGPEVALLRNTRDVAASMRYLTVAHAVGAAAVSLHQDGVTEAVVQRAHELGLTAYAWVVQVDAHERVLGAGVDGVVTDWPQVALALLRGSDEHC